MMEMVSQKVDICQNIKEYTQKKKNPKKIPCLRNLLMQSRVQDLEQGV